MGLFEWFQGISIKLRTAQFLKDSPYQHKKTFSKDLHFLELLVVLQRPEDIALLLEIFNLP